MGYRVLLKEVYHWGGGAGFEILYSRSISSSLCFETDNVMGLASLISHHHAFPTMIEYEAK